MSFSAEDLSRIKALVAHTKSATTANKGFNQFHGDPRVFNNAWNLYGAKPMQVYKPKPLGFGDHAKRMFTGFGKQIGHGAQALTVGHNGGRGLLKNLGSNLPDYARHAVTTPPSQSLPFIASNLKQDIVQPVKRMMPGMREAWNETGGMGGYLAEGPTKGYQHLKNWWNAPIRH